MEWQISWLPAAIMGTSSLYAMWKVKAAFLSQSRQEKQKRGRGHLQGKCYAVVIFTNLVIHRKYQNGSSLMSNSQHRAPGFMNYFFLNHILGK